MHGDGGGARWYILVHDYLRLDPDRVRAFRARAPRDFSDFAAAVRGRHAQQARRRPRL